MHPDDCDPFPPSPFSAAATIAALRAELARLQRQIARTNQGSWIMTVHAPPEKPGRFPEVFSTGNTDQHKAALQMAIDVGAITESGRYIVNRRCRDLSGSVKAFTVTMEKPVIS